MKKIQMLYISIVIIMTLHVIGFAKEIQKTLRIVYLMLQQEMVQIPIIVELVMQAGMTHAIVQFVIAIAMKTIHIIIVVIKTIITINMFIMINAIHM
jgi:hypothetical protein